MNPATLDLRCSLALTLGALAVVPLGRCLAAADTIEPPEARALLIDEQLAERSIVVVSLDDRVLTYFDEQQRRRTLARPAVLALIPQPIAEPAPRRRGTGRTSDAGALRLVDAQVFPGDLVPTGGGADSIAWAEPLIGQVVCPLENVLAFTRPGHAAFDAPAGIPDRSANDLLVLTNGDRLTGFLASAGNPIRIETEGGVVDLPPDRVAGARLANAPREPIGPRVWLADGAAAAVSRLAIDASLRVSFAVDQGPAVSLRWDQVRGMLFDSARLRPLSALDPASQQAGAERRYAPPLRSVSAADDTQPREDLTPALGAADLLFSGPMTVSWTLPPGAKRLAFSATLAPGSSPWGDCELVANLNGTELVRRRLHADGGAVPFALHVDAGTLTIAVEAGRFGPIRDWVILVRPLLLVDSPRTPSGD